MTITSINDRSLEKSMESAPFVALSATLQNLGKEWTEFVGMRLREDNLLLQTLHDCKTLPEMQHAYVQFWQNAFTQYGEEAQRMMRITQGAVKDAARRAEQQVETGTDTHQAA